MASLEGDIAEAVRNQIGKILASEGFARNDRLSSFLKFVVEQELSGSGDQLKESIIGVEVFGRRPDYDVRQDSVVRTEAGKLRVRLAKYYAAEGAAGQLIIQRGVCYVRTRFPTPARAEHLKTQTVLVLEHFCCTTSEVRCLSGKQRERTTPVAGLDRSRHFLFWTVGHSRKPSRHHGLGKSRHF